MMVLAEFEKVAYCCVDDFGDVDVLMSCWCVDDLVDVVDVVELSMY
jgi:hypothetical protein